MTTGTSQRSSIEVRLLGQRFALKVGDDLDRQTIEQVVALVTRKLEEAEPRSRNGAPLNVAVLALLDLAQEYVGAKTRTLEWQNRVNEKSAGILKLVERFSEAAPPAAE